MSEGPRHGLADYPMAGVWKRAKLAAMKSKRSIVTPSFTPSTPPPTQDQVAALAHAIWLDRGQPAGRDLDNWLEAERQLKGDVRRPLAADDIPADDKALEPESAMQTKVERELDDLGPENGPRSPTSL